jgi:hypothetical protein
MHQFPIDQSFVDTLREMAAENPHVTLRQFCLKMGCSENTVGRRFGAWNVLRVAAGLPESLAGRPACARGYTHDELIAALQRAVDIAGHDVSYDRFVCITGITYPAIARLFGSWTRLRAQLNLPQNRPQSPHSDDDLLATLDRLSLRLGRPPRSADIDALTPHAASTYRKRFGPAKKLQEALFKYRLKQALQKRLAGKPPASPPGEATRTPAASGSLRTSEPAGAQSNAPRSLFSPAPRAARSTDGER